MKNQDRQLRVEKANEFIAVIADCGRKFFAFPHPGGTEIAKFSISDKGQIYFLNEWTREWIYVSRYGPYKGFTHGGTLHSLVSRIVEYIKGNLPYFHESFFNAKHWAQDQSEMDRIVQKGRDIGLIKSQEPVLNLSN